MKIIRRLSDSMVIYMLPDTAQVTLTEQGLEGDKAAGDLRPSTHELVSGVVAPAIDYYGGCMSFINGVWAIADAGIYFFAANGITQEESAAADAQSIIDTKKTAIDNAIATYNAALAALEAAYPQRVRDTWPQQSAEAKAYQADPNATTAFLDGMLAKKPGVTKAELATKILNNYTAYSTLVGAALGAMQTTIEQINNP